MKERSRRHALLPDPAAAGHFRLTSCVLHWPVPEKWMRPSASARSSTSLPTTHIFRRTLGLYATSRSNAFDRALDLLSDAVDEKSAWVLWISSEPKLDAIRSEKRFDAIMDRSGLTAAIVRTSRG